MRRWHVPLLVGLFVVVLLSGCAGGGRHSSWPGMIVVDDTVYAANLEQVQALNTESGKLLWSFPMEGEKGFGPFYSTPVLAEDYGAHGLLLVAGFDDRKVYALALGESSAERPDLLWSFDGAAGQYVGSGTVAGSTFLIGNGDGNVYALNLEDGSPQWVFETGDRVWATPVVDGGIVYVASLDHHVYAVDMDSGEELWRTELGGAIASTPAIVAGGLWTGDFSEMIYKLDPVTGAVDFRYEADDWIWATPVVNDGILFFADMGGNIYGFNAETESLIWDDWAYVGDVVRGQPALSEDGDRLYIPGYETGEIFAVSVERGETTKWGTMEQIPGQLPGDLVAHEGRLYSMPILVDARIRTFDLEDGERLWVYPPAEE